MANTLKPVLRMAMVYALYVTVWVSAAIRLNDLWYAGAVAFGSIGGFVLLAGGSIWVARRSGERDIVLPAVAAMLGLALSTLALALITPSLRSAAVVVQGLIRSLSLGFIVTLEQAVTPTPLFSIAGVTFGFGIPWVLFAVYFAVFWNRRRSHNSARAKRHPEQA